MNGARWKPLRSWTPLLDPRTLPRGPVVVVAPHPDDEVIGCGGAIAFHVARGDAVHVVHVTGGEAGDPQQLFGGDLVATRLREAKAAAALLEVSSLTGLSFADGALAPEAPLVDALLAQFDRLCPAIVYAPSPLECHPDHLATALAAGRALARSPLAVRWLGYEVNHPTLASFLLDITPWIDRKREALACFASQQRYNDLIGKRLGLAYARTINIDLRGIEYVEAFFEAKPAQVEELFADLAAFHAKYGLP
ncbi:MAG: PIG-L family deacetylase [Planctomycetes bacterium]|nr:PIG-L family deacetylase [Planctomycetota bacterium]